MCIASRATSNHKLEAGLIAFASQIELGRKVGDQATDVDSIGDGTTLNFHCSI
jgi:hypothetical protein